MRNKFIAGTIILGASLVAVAAKADPGIFGQPVLMDGSMDMRRSTIEQFDPIRGQSVADRPRPDYDATPLSVGSFELFPAMNFTSYYDSNIFAQAQNESSDYVWKLNPAFSLLSNWGRDAVAVEGFGDFDYYSANSSQNYTSGAIQTEGRWDIAHQTWLSGYADYQRVTELDGAPDTPGNPAEPSQYNLYGTGTEFYRGLGLLKAKIDFDTSYYSYDPLELVGGGLENQNDRDRWQNKASTEVSYDMTENFQPFVRAGYNWRTYTADNTNSSDGQNVDVGSRMDFGGIITAEAYAGWLRQNYFNFQPGNGDDVQTPDFGADVLWNVTGLTSIEFKLSRTIEESDFAGFSSYIATGGELTVTHELRRNILIDAHTGYTNLDYQGAFRQDGYFDNGVGVRYFINRNLYADATYDYERRGTDATDENFNRHVLLTRLGVQY